MLFDGASGVVSCAKREVSTSALQPLWLLNSDFVQRAAQALAQRVEGADDPVLAAYQLVLYRDPTAEERRQVTEFLEAPGQTVADFCLALLNANEFLYLP